MTMRPVDLSREWFESWQAQHPDHAQCFPECCSEADLRYGLTREEENREAIDAEVRSHARVILRVQKLGMSRADLQWRIARLRERLIIMLRSQGRHEEADALMLPLRRAEASQRHWQKGGGRP